MRWQKVLQKQIMYFLSQWYRSRLAWTDEKDTEEIAGYVGAYLAAESSFLITNVAVFHHTDGSGAANQLMKALDDLHRKRIYMELRSRCVCQIMQQLHYMKKMVMKNLVFAKDFTANQRKMP